MSKTYSFRYMTDANMPRSVVIALADKGRDVLESGAAMSPAAKDQSIAQMAAENGFVLVSYDRDFVNIRRRMVQEMSCGDSHLILLKVPEMRASARLIQVIEEIERLFAEAATSGRVVDRVEVKADRVLIVFSM